MSVIKLFFTNKTEIISVKTYGSEDQCEITIDEKTFKCPIVFRHFNIIAEHIKRSQIHILKTSGDNQDNTATTKKTASISCDDESNIDYEIKQLLIDGTSYDKDNDILKVLIDVSSVKDVVSKSDDNVSNDSTDAASAASAINTSNDKIVDAKCSVTSQIIDLMILWGKQFANYHLYNSENDVLDISRFTDVERAFYHNTFGSSEVTDDKNEAFYFRDEDIGEKFAILTNLGNYLECHHMINFNGYWFIETNMKTINEDEIIRKYTDSNSKEYKEIAQIMNEIEEELIPRWLREEPYEIPKDFDPHELKKIMGDYFEISYQ